MNEPFQCLHTEYLLLSSFSFFFLSLFLFNGCGEKVFYRSPVTRTSSIIRYVRIYVNMSGVQLKFNNNLTVFYSWQHNSLNIKCFRIIFRGVSQLPIVLITIFAINIENKNYWELIIWCSRNEVIKLCELRYELVRMRSLVFYLT